MCTHQSLRVRPAMAPLACFLLLVGLATNPLEAVKRRAFVTSITGTGDLGSWPEAGSATGLAAGNAICRARANAAGLPNANAYRAWLSNATTDAYCHVRGQSGVKGSCTGGTPLGAGPWYLANGITNFTGSLDALTNDLEIYRPVTMNEFGAVIPEGDRRYFTGTAYNGTRFSTAPWHCSGWTSEDGSAIVGDAYGTADRWTEGGPQSCSSFQRLLCLEPGTSETTSLPWSTGHLVFLTKTSGSGDLNSWPTLGGQIGLAAGDATCQVEAAMAGLPDPASFVAWLSTASVDARDRVTTNGPFKRLDGYTVANNKADLIDGSLDTTIHQHRDGDYVLGVPEVATGTLADGTASGTDCNGWTSASSTHDATYGHPNWARIDDWTVYLPGSCNSPRRLYCLSNRAVLFWDGFDLTGDTSRWSSAVP